MIHKQNRYSKLTMKRWAPKKIFCVTYGIGIVITTSCNSSWSCSNSYSILTSQPPCPLSEGQQLTEKGKKDLHFHGFKQIKNGEL